MPQELALTLGAALLVRGSVTRGTPSVRDLQLLLGATLADHVTYCKDYGTYTDFLALLLRLIVTSFTDHASTVI